jgi:hypothetical protein
MLDWLYENMLCGAEGNLNWRREVHGWTDRHWLGLLNYSALNNSSPKQLTTRKYMFYYMFQSFSWISLTYSEDKIEWGYRASLSQPFTSWDRIKGFYTRVLLNVLCFHILINVTCFWHTHPGSEIVFCARQFLSDQKCSAFTLPRNT